jgi:hypothetical protein
MRAVVHQDDIFQHPTLLLSLDSVRFVNPRFEEERHAALAAAGASATQLCQYGTGKRCNATAAGGSSAAAVTSYVRV